MHPTFRFAPLALAAGLFAPGPAPAAEDCTREPTGNGAIFFPPDGYL